MNINNIIISELNRFLSENNDFWYHGTPDVRDLEKEGGFTKRTMYVDYIPEIEKYEAIQNDLEKAHKTDKEQYFKILSKISDFKKSYNFNKPVFLTNKASVAKTYADPSRALDFQGAKEKVLKTKVNCNKAVKIIATGDNFRKIDINKVIRGFVTAGVDESRVESAIKMFNYARAKSNKIQTDKVAAIADYLDFDCVDVIGVLDSYQGGSEKSTVKMVLDPASIKIVK